MSSAPDWFHRGDPRREREIDQLWARVEYIDAHGTRGIGGIAAQLAGVTADLAELKLSTRLWQERHELAHEKAASSAVAGRRWVVGTCIAALVMLVAVLGLMLQLTGQVR